MKRKVALILAIGIVVWLAGCDPQEGDPCPHAGDLWTKHGHTLHCTPTRHGNEWTG